MRKKEGYVITRFGARRWVVAAATSVSRDADMIHLMTEVDVSEVRRRMRAHREQTGERLSMTAYVVACLARTMQEHREWNAFRKGRRLVLLDDLTLSVLVERHVGEERIPEPVGIQNADRKSYREIHDELRAAQQQTGHFGSLSGMTWINSLPRFLLVSFVRWASRSVSMQKRYGVVAVTAVGMFSTGALWLLPISSATVGVAVGGIVRRPAIVGGALEEREYLCLTVSLNHDIIDGAPGARFVRCLSERLSAGDELDSALGGAAVGSSTETAAVLEERPPSANA